MHGFTIAVALGLLASAPDAVQPAFDVKELAEFRLTAADLKKFEQASGLIAEVIQHDAHFAESPLFTKEVSLSGDAPAMAARLEVRLRDHLSLVQALDTAKMTAHEYARFALVLLGAHLAHGFVDSGVLRYVPPGVPTDNVIFVEKYLVRIGALLKTLGIER